MRCGFYKLGHPGGRFTVGRFELCRRPGISAPTRRPQLPNDGPFFDGTRRKPTTSLGCFQAYSGRSQLQRAYPSLPPHSCTGPDRFCDWASPAALPSEIRAYLSIHYSSSADPPKRI